MNITWNAEGYAKDFQFVHQYGEDVMGLLDIQRGERVLDLGCGNGVLTNKLAEMGAEVIGIDASKEMLEIAEKNYPGISFQQGNATEFVLASPVRAVFSNAVFHWIDDQDALLSRIAHALEPGGQLVCEFGGQGCTETIHRALEQAFQNHGYSYQRTFYFPTIGKYAPLLEKHGLLVVFSELFDRPTKLIGDHGVADWIRMFVKKPFEEIPEKTVEAMILEAEELTKPALYQHGVWYADYVRIRIKAIKIA